MSTDGSTWTTVVPARGNTADVSNHPVSASSRYVRLNVPTRPRHWVRNVILLTNLAWSAWLFLGFVRGRLPFARLEHWQTRYVIVYAVWAWTLLALPLVFDFA
ncbi:hypothetical protein [Micromonospora sp. L31]|uniref:hypothetical protein n=1 Tax=Micromonospora sp. L31 TaxID=3452213 RepID=UPI003F8C37FB